MGELTPQGEGEISRLLRAWSEGEAGAFDDLIPIVYRELHQIAARYLNRERAGHSLQASALVNEAYLRLLQLKQIQWNDRSHFFAVSSQAMRRILVEHARRRNLKRGGGLQRVPLDEEAIVAETPEMDFVALDRALTELERLDPRKTRIVEMRFFGGLSIEETGELLNLSPMTIKREWRSARAWLYRELTGDSIGT
jgi:RNA polymerase sigma factor (TIGR02999 family)